MKEKARYDEMDVPSWAACYLINGDDSGLTADERADVDRFMEGFYSEAAEVNGNVIISMDGEGYFSRSPEFGLPCDCMEGTVVILY